MSKRVVLSIVFLLFVLAGGLGVGLLNFLPDGAPRTIAVMLFGITFVSIYIGLLVSRVRQVLDGTTRFLFPVSSLLLELTLLLSGFALMYQRLGIMDNTSPGSPVSHDFWHSLYYSVITFTTVGYGDFYPTGLGRALAALQGLSGYIVLGVLASTAASVASPHSPAGPSEAKKDPAE